MPKTIKCLLRSFLTQEGQELLLPRIAEAVPIMNKLVTETYHLMNLHFRRMLEADARWIPNTILDENYVLNFMRVLHETTDYAPEKDILETKTLLYDPLRAAAGLDTLVRPFPTALIQIKKYAANEMAVSIRNNVLTHFSNRLRKFVDFAHPDLSKDERSALITTWWNAAHSSQHPLLFPPPHYLVGPKNQPASVEYTLQASPEVFFPAMWYMLRVYDSYNSHQPANPRKLFHLLPVRQGFINHHIRIDSHPVDSWTRNTLARNAYLDAKEQSLARERLEIQNSANPTKRLHRDKSVTAAERDVLWEPLIRKRALRGLGRYHFGYSFTTNGVDVSILCEEDLSKSSARKKKKHQSAPVQASYFPNDGRKIVGADPGKHSILYMTSDSATPGPGPKKFERLEYRTRRRRHDLRVKHFANIRSSRKEEHLLQSDVDIQELETSLSRQNPKAPFILGFSNYLQTRFSHQQVLYAFYDHPVYPTLRFKSFQGRQKSERRLVNDIQRVFGSRESIILALGDWSESTQMKGCVPSPVVGIKNALSKHFTICVVSEYNTTKTCSKCGGRMAEDLLRKRCRTNSRTGEVNLIENRALRRCQNVACGVRFSRDYNAAINIRRQALHLRDHQTTHPWFTKPVAQDQGT